jgi:predicted ribosome quality control (RQC) complex YloA/Tae2 family protein
VQTFVFKLSRSGDDGEKVHLLLESGIRFHTTAFARDKNMIPSSVSMKLRKHLRSKRITDVSQLGVDRIADFSFGSGEAQHHVLLELYAAGNIILTDAAYRVLTLLRVHKDDERGTAVAAGLPYPVQLIRLYDSVSREQLATALAEASDKVVLKRACHPNP